MMKIVHIRIFLTCAPTSECSFIHGSIYAVSIKLKTSLTGELTLALKTYRVVVLCFIQHNVYVSFCIDEENTRNYQRKWKTAAMLDYEMVT